MKLGTWLHTVLALVATVLLRGATLDLEQNGCVVMFP